MDVKRTMDDWGRQHGGGPATQKREGDSEIDVRAAIHDRGKKHHGFLTMGIRADGSPIRLAVTVISGSKKGPILAVDAGVHGDEMEGTEAVIRVIQQLDHRDIVGTRMGRHEETGNFEANEARTDENELVGFRFLQMALDVLGVAQ